MAVWLPSVIAAAASDHLVQMYRPVQHQCVTRQQARRRKGTNVDEDDGQAGERFTPIDPSGRHRHSTCGARMNGCTYAEHRAILAPEEGHRKILI